MLWILYVAGKALLAINGPDAAAVCAMAADAAEKAGAIAVCALTIGV